MSKTMENVKTVNSVVRTTIMVGFLGLFGFLAWLGYDNWIKPAKEAAQLRQEMAQLQVKFEEQTKELVKTQTALKLVKVDHRKATIKVLETGDDNGAPFFVVQFVEVHPDGTPISEPREYRLKGTLMFVDSWVVKFDDKYIEEADELRAASLCVFKSIWGDLDERSGGQALDQNDAEVETAYGTLDPKNEFEQKIWDDFWTVSNDPVRQQELGIRASHGQVNYLQVRPGMVYEVDLRASDGLTLRPALNIQNTSIPNGG